MHAKSIFGFAYFPRLISRGPIEAIEPEAIEEVAAEFFPRLISRGPIEAIKAASSYASAFPSFRG